MPSLPEHCHGEKTHFSRNERRTITPFTYPLVFLLTCPFANTPADVNYSVRNLTLWVPFLFTNGPPCRKKSILAKVCFDGKRVVCECWQNEYLFSKDRHLHQFWGVLLQNEGRFGAKCSAFWCKMQGVLVLNAMCFGAKCNAFWC